MLNFNNITHRQVLERLGILQSHEYSLLEQELARRVFISPHAEEALYIVKQEMSHHLQKHLIIEMNMEIVKELVSSINDLDTLLAAITAFYELAEIIRQANDESKNMKDFLKALEQFFIIQSPPALTTLRAKEHFDGFAKLVKDVLVQSNSIRTAMKRDFVNIFLTIQSKGADLIHH